LIENRLPKRFGFPSQLFTLFIHEANDVLYRFNAAKGIRRLKQRPLQDNEIVIGADLVL
jgi:hypothetical protein